MKRFDRRRGLGLVVAGALAVIGAMAGEASGPAAERVAHAASARLQAVAWAGRRAVAVGEHGLVLLSDDAGQQWRQARSVPFDGVLTAVHFVDGQQGWAVGHAGVVLHTADGGETWGLQRRDDDNDRPLFAVHFFDAREGVAVGLWSLVLVTDDGGVHWREQPPPPAPGARKADLNLHGLFTTPGGELLAVAERGMVLRSADRGRSWSYQSTGYAGSFWCGTALADGTLLVGGLRGSLYRSADGGHRWSRVPVPQPSSITALAVAGDRVFAAGADGLLLQSGPGGVDFTALPVKEGIAFTGLLAGPSGRLLAVSSAGPWQPRP